MFFGQPGSAILRGVYIGVETMVRKSLYVVLTALLLSLGSAGHADTLIIEGLDQAGAGSRPSRGMSMDNVQAKWGQPRMKRNAVGDPPITRWEYDGFVVYFEYSNVIHSVQRR